MMPDTHLKVKKDNISESATTYTVYGVKVGREERAARCMGKVGTVS